VRIRTLFRSKISKPIFILGFLSFLMLELKAQDSTLTIPSDTLAVLDSTLNVDGKMLAKKDSIPMSPKVSLKKVFRSTFGEEKGTVRIIQDERINTLDRVIKDEPYKHDGFRIQIIFGSQNLINGKKTSFQNKYDYPTYVDFLAPNFRLRVGDFPTKQLAEKHLHKIRKSFPNAYIVKAKINIPSDYR